MVRALRDAERVVASRLSIVETRRTLTRLEAEKAPRGGRIARAHDELAKAINSWTVMEMTDEVLARVEGRFPKEPVRTLDAIHLATAHRFHELVGPVHLLSHDARILDNWRALGLPLA